MALDALTKILKIFERDAFDIWLEAKSPSGDVEQVQRQWESSSEYSEFCDKWADARAAIAALQAEPTDTSILVRLHRPEGYEDVHPELVLEDANINPAFLPELATPPKD